MGRSQFLPLLGPAFGEKLILNKSFRDMVQAGRQEERKSKGGINFVQLVLLGKLGRTTASLYCVLQTLRKIFTSCKRHTTLRIDTVGFIIICTLLPEEKIKTRMGKIGCYIWKVQG